MTGGELLRIVSERDALLAAATELLRWNMGYRGQRDGEARAFRELDEAVKACLGQIRDPITNERVRR